MRKVSACLLALAAALLAIPVPRPAPQTPQDMKPSGRNHLPLQHGRKPLVKTNFSLQDLLDFFFGMHYHGGPVLSQGIPVYLIWYGSWSDSSTPDILRTLVNGLAWSPLWHVNTEYYDQQANVRDEVWLAGEIWDSYSRGSQLTDADIQAIVDAQNPPDQRSVYIVLTSKDVAETSGFCSKYCGFHGMTKTNGTPVQYAFIGDTDQCPNACEAQTASSPNGNTGADGMANTLVHELEEAATDPHLDAWYDLFGQENADKCVWNFGATYQTPNGSLANMNLGGRDYLIQQQWKRSAPQGCVQHLP